MRYVNSKKIYILMLLSLVFLGACSQKEPITFSSDPVVIAVAPFNQPRYEAQLLAGYIPSEQSPIDGGRLANYNEIFKQKLAATNHKFIYLNPSDIRIAMQEDSKGRKNVLTTWAKLAQENGADFIIVPQVIDFAERRGDELNVRVAARFISDIYLIRATHPETNSNDGFLQTRSHYRQVTFVRSTPGSDNNGSVTHRQRQEAVFFAREAMDKAIREFRL